MNLTIVESIILDAFPESDVRVEDLRGDGTCYAIFVSSYLFSGKTRLEQHRMVYKALGKNIGDIIHAITLQTDIPGRLS